MWCKYCTQQIPMGQEEGYRLNQGLWVMVTSPRFILASFLIIMPLVTLVVFLFLEPESWLPTISPFLKCYWIMFILLWFVWWYEYRITENSSPLEKGLNRVDSDLIIRDSVLQTTSLSHSFCCSDSITSNPNFAQCSMYHSIPLITILITIIIDYPVQWRYL